ncbi:MAG: hypothetical protein Q9227_008353 [Pyrenula ochraceoflavens]
MSAPHPTSSTPAPWKKLFVSHLEKLGSSPEFTFATLHPDPAGAQPRVRYCIHRGFWAALPENKHNTLSKNPQVYDSDCPIFTSDSRMEKVYELFATGKGKGSREQSLSGTGGGGPAEACYWVKEVMCQWRIRGKCWLLGVQDIEEQNSGTVTVKGELGRYMRDLSQDSDNSEDAKNAKKWSWPLEIQNVFENLSPTMRGSFKNPWPGHAVSEGMKEGEALGQKAGSLMDEAEEVARKNFRVAVITPEEVECVDLTDPEKSRRWRWTLAEEVGGPGGDGQEVKPVGDWNEVELWP